MALRRVCKLGPGQVLSNSFDRYRNFVSFSTWPEWLSPDLGGRQRTMVPLNQSLSDGTSSPSGYKAPAKQPPTELTTLANGVRIISEATPVSIMHVPLSIHHGAFLSVWLTDKLAPRAPLPQWESTLILGACTRKVYMQEALLFLNACPLSPLSIALPRG